MGSVAEVRGDRLRHGDRQRFERPGASRAGLRGNGGRALLPQGASHGKGRAMKPKSVYAALCVVGAIVPYAVFLPFVREHGLDMGLIVRELFVNRVSASFAADVFLSSVAFWAFVAIEGR